MRIMDFEIRALYNRKKLMILKVVEVIFNHE